MKGTGGVLAVLVIFLLVSCAPKGEKGVAERRTGKRAEVVSAVGHETEVALRGAATDSTLHRIVGNSMSRYDREQLNHVYDRGVSGQAASWTNPEQGTQYRVTPQPAYQVGGVGGNRICRKAELIAIISLNVDAEKVDTVACRAGNGQWRIREER